MSSLSIAGIALIGAVILALLILRRKGQASITLGWRCLIWEIEYLGVSLRIRSVMRRVATSGGERSPCVKDLQQAFQDEAELRRRHPIAKSA